MTDADVKVLFGKRVRQLRKAKGVSQEAFAHEIQIDRSYFGSIERGERNVSLDNICLIAKGLGVSPAELLMFDQLPASESQDNAADEVLVPIQCEYYALEGLGQLLRNVDLVRRNLNPTLEVSTIVCVMYDARTKLADQVVKEVREHFGDKVLRTVVPRTVRLSEAPSFGQPIITFDSTSRGAAAYRSVAKEVSHGSTRRPG